MKYAQIQVLPQTPPGGVTAGIDWASADHVACVVDAAGQVRARFSVTHDRAGIRKLITGLRAAGVSEAAIECSDGALVDAMLDAGLTVAVITSRQMKNLRSRYGSAGAKDDRFDAFVLADALRTGRSRLRPLIPDTPATVALRAAVRARRDLVAHRIAACSQLRAQLAAVFPGAVGLFAALDSQISLAFLARFPSQEAVDQLSEVDLAAWLRTLPHRGKAPRPGQLHARLQAAARGTAGADGTARAPVTGALVATLTTLTAQIKALEADIAAQLAEMGTRPQDLRAPAGGGTHPRLGRLPAAWRARTSPHRLHGRTRHGGRRAAPTARETARDPRGNRCRHAGRARHQRGTSSSPGSLADAVSVRPWTPQYDGLQRYKVTHHGTEQKRPA